MGNISLTARRSQKDEVKSKEARIELTIKLSRILGVASGDKTRKWKGKHQIDKRRLCLGNWQPLPAGYPRPRHSSRVPWLVCYLSTARNLAGLLEGGKFESEEGDANMTIAKISRSADNLQRAVESLAAACQLETRKPEQEKHLVLISIFALCVWLCVNWISRWNEFSSWNSTLRFKLQQPFTEIQDSAFVFPQFIGIFAQSRWLIGLCKN